VDPAEALNVGAVDNATAVDHFVELARARRAGR
jgi:acetoacetyl-CoA synthetase